MLSKRARERGLFDSRGVEAMLERHARGEDHGDRIWNLLVLELWHLEVADRLRASASSSVSAVEDALPQ